MSLYPQISGVNYESLVDGSGVRTVIFLSGCPHHCPGCHNPETWDDSYGKQITDEIVHEIAEEYCKRYSYLSGITLSGGDPLWHPERTLYFYEKLTKEIASLMGENTEKINLWIYTGYTFSQLQKRRNSEPELATILDKYADVIVDGPFIKDLADKRLAFRGSSNQKIIRLNKDIE